jgi:MFS family permease
MRGIAIPDAVVTEGASRPRRTALLAGAAWLATVGMGIGSLWVVFGTDFIQVTAAANGVTPTPDELLVLHAVLIAFFAVVLGYASVGALLAGRIGAARIAALLLAGGASFALIPFGYLVGGHLSAGDPNSALFAAILLLGPVAIGPGYVLILPGIALAFPDGRLPSGRWRRPVGIAAVVVAVGTLLQLVTPGFLAGASSGPRNPLGIETIPVELGNVAYITVAIGILMFSALGLAAVAVRYRRGDAVERQQLRWFLAAVSLGALPLALSAVPGIGGPETGLLAAGGLILVPIAVGIAVTRYRLYEIDHLISRTLVYVPLTALLAGLYAATVTLLQRVFQSVTGDKSDAAIIISTLILASVFTPVRKWLEGIVERRFRPTPAATAVGVPTAADWDARMTAIALRVVRAELDAHAQVEAPAANR